MNHSSCSSFTIITDSSIITLNSNTHINCNCFTCKCSSFWIRVWKCYNRSCTITITWCSWCYCSIIIICSICYTGNSKFICGYWSRSIISIIRTTLIYNNCYCRWVSNCTKISIWIHSLCLWICRYYCSWCCFFRFRKCKFNWSCTNCTLRIFKCYWSSTSYTISTKTCNINSRTRWCCIWNSYTSYISNFILTSTKSCVLIIC